MTLPKGSTPNWAIAGWKKIPVDFGPWPGIVVTRIKPVPFISEVLGLSRAETRRRIEHGEFLTCASTTPARHFPPWERVGFEEMMVEPGCMIRLPYPPTCCVIEVIRKPYPWWRRLLAQVWAPIRFGLWVDWVNR